MADQTEDPTIQFGPESPTQVPPQQLDTTWGGFQLLNRVGAGGFGEVYRAWDPNLQREIAVKLLLPGTVDSEAEFQTTLHEARALASVKHPNIVSIYGCDRHDGRVGFWTDFVHGKTLASLLVTQGSFGYHEAALIGLEITRALSAVHRANLLHRDIKPENVMREEGGRILLMDFGLSALPQHTSQLAGTPNYMAPELFRRRPASVCTDIYAVGVLLYFLVTGQTPARLNGLTTAQAAEACTQRKPLIDLRSDLPEAFLRIVNRAIALAPEDRFRSAGEMAEALAASLGASSASHSAAYPTPRPAPPPPPVLDSAPIKEEKKKRPAWLKYGITVIVLLSIFGRRLPLVSLLYSRDAAKPEQVKVGGLEVSNEEDDKPDPSDLYDQAQSLLLKSYKESNLNAAIEKFKQIPDSDPNYPLALAGLGSAHFIQYRNTQDAKLLDQATAESNRAIRLNPSAAPPYVTLARIAAAGGKNAVAMQMAEKAMSLDHSNPDAYRAQADVLDAEGRHDEAIAALEKAADLAPDDWRFPMRLGVSYVGIGDLKKAAEEFKLSAKLADDNALPYYNLAHVDIQLDRLDDARANIQRVLEINPDAPTYEELSWVDIETGAHSDAIAASLRATELEPSSYVAWSALGGAYGMVPADHQKSEDAYRKAIGFGEEARKKEPKDAELIATLALCYSRIADKARANKMVRQAVALSPNNPNVDYLAGSAAESAGDRQQAILLIAKCIGVGYSLAEIDRDPDLAALRADPRFQQHLYQISHSKS